MTPTTEELAAELDELAPHMALGPNQSATLRAAAARLRELSEVIRKAHRISTRHDHEITRLVDLQDLLAAQLTETHSEP